MANYSYHTSQKSYLDLKQDKLWDILVLNISKYLPWVTPNMVTLMGIFPIFTIFSLFITGLIGDIAYLFMFPAMIFYLNMDAIDGKLARFTNRASTLGQMLDHGCDASSVGMITLMLSYMGSLDRLYEINVIVSFRLIVFTAVYALYISVLACNITEFYTGGMITSIGSFGTTEVSYCLSLLFLFAYLLRNYYVVMIFDLMRYVMIMMSIMNAIYLFRNLLNIDTNEKRKGTEKNVVNFNIRDIQHFILTLGIGIINGYLSNFSIPQTATILIYIVSSIIDIIYSSGMKYDIIHYDYGMVLLQSMKCVCGFLFGFGYLTAFIDILAFTQLCSDKMDKSDIILEQRAVNTDINI